jgi:hypothetical protein
MNKHALTIALVILILAAVTPTIFSFQTANAQTSGYTIQNVDHTIQILYTGQLVISDAFQLSGTTPSTIQIGFPYKYGIHVLKAVAFDQNKNALTITTGQQLQGQTGFYAATVDLPSNTVNFTASFIFDNGLVTTNSNGVSQDLDYPAYPSLTATAGKCNVLIVFPSDTTSIQITKPDGNTNTSIYSASNLAAFTYAPAVANFRAPSGSIQFVNIPTLDRVVSVNLDGSVSCVDTYRLKAISGAVSSFVVDLPTTATGFSARDGFGRSLQYTYYQANSLLLAYNVSFAVSMTAGESSQLVLAYSLPNVARQGDKYVVNLDLFPQFDYYVNQASVTLVPPEGASIELPALADVGSSVSLSRNVFQESLTVSRAGVTYVESNLVGQDVMSVTYSYSPLWIGFRPTIWVWAIALVGCVVIALWTRPRAKAPMRIVVPKMAAGLTPEHVRVFTDAYEERNKLMTEIRLLEARVQRGRMPRRRYKVQRTTLETRMESLSRTIGEIKQVMVGSGGIYADLVGQLERAEVELEEVSMALDNAEAKHATGELPIDVYRRQVAELERRKAKAETTLSGLLLRLRQEVR